MTTDCKLCGSPTVKIKHHVFNIYYRCTNCEYIRKDKSFFLSPKEELHIYDNHNNSIDDPRYVEYFYKFLNDAVFDFAPKGKKGLDFGSGPSPVLAQILERDHDYHMDIYDLFYAKYKVYEGKKYDLVTSTEVAEHIKDPISYFRLLKSLLKEEGILAIMTLFHNNDDDHFLNWHYIRDKSHISFYTLKTLEFIAGEVGLEIIHSNNERYTTFMLDRS
ncbi:class I SAM-dependent methyltransferase [Alkalibacter mobilis]|uniref:class I SAM-dependent methyltransferase n=1 Tax=Alkalibacter mobilis TaxID=2787712 RepID=UPI00189CE3E9|nr:class I SAM-dependent methyltransferase [Alkalibacter mobilis]MBF7097490.1 class I SAM-dependent methyltransferase [Alkalibacter mobilis]